MTPIVLDLETFYDREYSLSKITTEAYVRDSRFEVIGIAIKVGDNPTQWYPQPEVVEALASIDWSDKMVVCQNTAFDGAILAWRYNVSPLAWADTLGMSRALYPHDKSHSLSAQATRLGVGVKGTEVLNALGKRYVDFSAEELARYAAYCVNDVELTHTLFHRYLGMGFPKQELRLIDATLRMFIEPKLVLDHKMLVSHLAAVKDHKQKLLDDVRDSLIGDYSDSEAAQVAISAEEDGLKKLLMSNDKFAKLLERFGVEPPMKVSPTTGKLAYAFAKTDEAFKELAEHPDVRVQALVAARLGNKTTLEETRTERFIYMASRGAFPVPLRYYGAHSGRWSGQDSVNLQNLPSRGPYAKALKRAIKAPPGHVVIDCDSAQIEARCLAWLAGQDDLVQAFRDKQDVYKIMASHIYGVAPDQINKEQRQVGKVVVLGCIAEGELVLTDSGLVPIEKVTTSQKVWDGVEWVTHEGPIYQGEQVVITYDCLTATPDHIVYLQDGTSCRFDQAAAAALSIARTGDGGVPLRTSRNCIDGDTARETPENLRTLHDLQDGEVDKPSERKARHDQRLPEMQPTATRSGLVKQATWGGESTLRESESSTVPRLWGAGDSVSVCISSASSVVAEGGPRLAQTSGARPNRQQWALCAGQPSLDNTEGSKFEQEKRSQSDSVAPVSETVPGNQVRGHDLTSIDGNTERRGNSGPVAQHAVVQTKRRVWDILNAGPRHRFTVSNRLVSNCGYGVGHGKLKAFLKSMAGVEVTEAEAKRIINAYRNTYHYIPYLWDKANQAIQALYSGQELAVDVPGLVRVDPGKGLTLPSGLHIQYPELRREYNDEGKAEWRYTTKGLPTRVYGGLCVENFTQAIARCIVAEQLLRIRKRYPVVLTVHDSVACIAPADEAEAAMAYVVECMSWNPKWATGLPLSCEAGYGDSYGDC